jgi:hypothetical protein
MLDNDEFVNDLLSVMDNSDVRAIFGTAYLNSENRNDEKFNAMVEKYLS